MKTLLLATSALLSLTQFTLAQDLPQAGSDWFKSGQATIEARLANAPIPAAFRECFRPSVRSQMARRCSPATMEKWRCCRGFSRS